MGVQFDRMPITQLLAIRPRGNDWPRNTQRRSLLSIALYGVDRGPIASLPYTSAQLMVCYVGMPCIRYHDVPLIRCYTYMPHDCVLSLRMLLVNTVYQHLLEPCPSRYFLYVPICQYGWSRLGSTNSQTLHLTCPAARHHCPLPLANYQLPLVIVSDQHLPELSMCIIGV